MIKYLTPKTYKELKAAEKQDKRENYLKNLNRGEIFTYVVFFIVFLVLSLIDKTSPFVGITMFCFFKIIIEFIPKDKN